jgi:16S rRNA (guanine966-N2)-methyltransferase
VRIVRGRWAGRDLVSPGARVRPTSEEVRDRWLTLLKADLREARVLDLFAGTGALGLEALSRGAARVDFVENGAASLHSLKANVAALRVKRRTRIFKRDAIPFVESLEANAYDIAFADPPYGSAKLDRVVARWLEVPFSRILTFEHDRSHRIGARGKRYDMPGDTRLTILRAAFPSGSPADHSDRE